jgi:hypothetical protein
MQDNWRKHFTAAFIDGMPTPPVSYYDLYKNVTGHQTYPLQEFTADKQKSVSRFSFGANKNKANNAASNHANNRNVRFFASCFSSRFLVFFT